MDAYEFSTQVTETGYVAIPTEYVDQLPQGTAVRVLILVDKQKVETNGYNRLHDDFGSLPDGNLPEQLTLEALIAEIKRKPSNPEHIHSASGKLAEHLADPATEPDPAFDPAEWDREWAEIEANMKAASLAHEEEERLTWAK